MIEISVKAWDPKDERNLYSVGNMKAHPLHEDEIGKVHMRRHAVGQTVCFVFYLECSKSM